MSAIHRIYSYLNYWLHAVNEHSLHAPYVYDLYKKVLKNNIDSRPNYKDVRHSFLVSKNTIDVNDYGAGSSHDNKSRRKVRDIAKKGVINEKYGCLLQKLVDYTEPKNIVELGTSLGISTLYLSQTESVEVDTFEGSDSLISIAASVFESKERTNIKIHSGNIDDILTEYLMRRGKIDFAFIDANHTYKATVDYFNQLSSKAHDGSCFVFDDIHWSKEMSKAWELIIKDYRVTLSIDLYQMGIIFFNPEIRKQHYIIEY